MKKYTLWKGLPEAQIAGTMGPAFETIEDAREFVEKSGPGLYELKGPQGHKRHVLLFSIRKPRSNPKGRKMATAKQIAWRKKFAAMAKAGTLRKGGKRRVRNPKPVPIKKTKAQRREHRRRVQHTNRAIARGNRALAKNARKSNPMMSGFAVNVGVGGDRMHKIATFRDKSRAIEYAKALHRKTGRRVSVTH